MLDKEDMELEITDMDKVHLALQSLDNMEVVQVQVLEHLHLQHQLLEVKAVLDKAKVDMETTELPPRPPQQQQPLPLQLEDKVDEEDKDKVQAQEQVQHQQQVNHFF